MNAPESIWPRKRREVHNHHFDSTIWNDFAFRDDDIVIATYAKSGTTWTQQIVAQMLFGGDPPLAVAAMSPWLDLRVPPKAVKLEAVEAQTHRRILKTHLPVDALVFSPRAKYLYIARDGRDVVWSLYNHHANANSAWYAALRRHAGARRRSDRAARRRNRALPPSRHFQHDAGAGGACDLNMLLEMLAQPCTAQRVFQQHEGREIRQVDAVVEDQGGFHAAVGKKEAVTELGQMGAVGAYGRSPWKGRIRPAASGLDYPAKDDAAQ